jgi:folylpolyglutamate synthase/dihydropteroate synthase
MMQYEQTIKYLYDLQPIGIKFGLHNTLSLLNYFHNPHQKIRTIHVAGTNGKGSTCSMIASILQAAGYRVGLYTSPHLIDFTERILINGLPITQSEVVRLTGEIQQAIRDGDFSSGHPTFFEVVTVMAMAYFHEQQVDFAVMEVGMGGRLDATNVIQPLLGIITNIDLEHQQYLGNSLLEIAREKAGIIKKGMPVITGDQQPEVLQLLADICQERGATLIPVPSPSPSFVRPLSQDLRGQSFEVTWPAAWSDTRPAASAAASAGVWPGVWSDRRSDTSPGVDGASPSIPGISIDLPGVSSAPPDDSDGISPPDSSSPDITSWQRFSISLIGEHQIQNALVALAAIQTLSRLLPCKISLSRISEGISLARWPGRAEVYSCLPAIMVDGAHNPAGARRLSCLLEGLGFSRLILVLGIMKDKEIDKICQELVPLASKVILTRPRIERAASPEVILNILASRCLVADWGTVSTAEDIPKAITLARAMAGQQDLICITGSLYTVGEAKVFLDAMQTCNAD